MAMHSRLLANSILRYDLNIFGSCLRSFSLSSVLPTNYGGVYIPITTPFTSKEIITYDKLTDNLNKWNQTKLKGYFVEGSSGESVLLTLDERAKLVAKARSLIPKDKILLAGSGCESTGATAELSKQMADAGADAVMVVTPSYFKASLNDRSLIAHFETVADQSPVPVLLYSVPANTGVDLSVAAVRVLSRHPNILGMKESSGDVQKLAALVQETKDQQFQVLAGSAGYLLPALRVGCVGGVCALANVLPQAIIDLYERFNTTKTSDGAAVEELEALQRRLLAPNTAVTRQFGVPGLKLAMELLGYYGGPTRRPLLPLEEADAQELRKIFVQAGFLE